MKASVAPEMLPLKGITVVSVEQAVAAPFATRQLADYGARVIKVERPPSGDFARGYDSVVEGLSSHFVWLNRSKESIALDLRQNDDRRAMDALLARADIFVQNLGPGAADRLGLGPVPLRERFPRLIVCSITGYGTSGPYGDRKAYDLLVQAETGLLSITGTPETPSKVGISIADIAAGMYAAQGILLALHHRHKTGEGMRVDVSLFDALAEWMGFPAYYTAYGGDPPPRTGPAHATIAPYGPFRAGDGRFVYIGIQNDAEWRRFCEFVLKDPALATDTRFDNNPNRVQHRQELQELVERCFASETSEEVQATLSTAGIACATLKGVQELLQHPQVVERGRLKEVGSPAGDLMAMLPPIFLEGVEPVLGPIPSAGQHTASILAELGLSDASQRD